VLAILNEATEIMVKTRTSRTDDFMRISFLVAEYD
jgi:hypothetical protein